MKRREILLGGGSVIAGWVLPGCNNTRSQSALPANVVAGLIDAHCHVFNGSDLPGVRFIKAAVLENYPKQAVRTLDIDDPDAVDGLLALLLFILERPAPPSAVAEAALLAADQPANLVHLRGAQNEAAVIDAIAEFGARDRTAAATAGGASPKAVDAIVDSLLAAAGQTRIATGSQAPPEVNRETAEKAFRSKADIGQYLRWFALFTRYRHSLADDLARTHRAQGFEAVLLCPALIDYDFWLHQNVDRSPLPGQVTVMGRIARRKTGPVVHGYVGYDPLRQAYFASGKRAAFDPLALVRKAIREEGFLGVKLYPPMGFKPLGNEADSCQIYDETIVRDLGTSSRAAPDVGCDPRPALGSTAVGKRLDDAMAALFDLCVAEEACVVAHANESNAAGPGYARRADPAHWIAVFRRWPRLRVNLAHFGHFSARSAMAPAATQMPQASWEWALGRYISEARDPPVFADVSYLTEVFRKPDEEMRKYLAIFKAWISQFDPECRHLVFGTDWTMLGLEASYETYTKSTYAFFRDGCGFDRKRLDRLLVGNAGRFLGLRDGDPARGRLIKFYADNGLPIARLPRVDFSK